MRHVVTPEPSPAGWRAQCHEARGDARALITGRSWSHGTRDDTRALSWWVVYHVPWGTWRCQSFLALRAGLEPRGDATAPEPSPAGCGVWRRVAGLKSYARGYPVCRVPTVAPKPTSGEAANPQVRPIPFPFVALMIFVLDNFKVMVRFHQRARGAICSVKEASRCAAWVP
jgi:hypothetical protein